jgi:hypothetical protein
MTYDEKTLIEMYTNWYPVLDTISNKKNKNIIELGCGIGTKKLCEEFKSVFSFETAKDNYWYKKTEEDLKNFKNWHGYFRSFEHYGIDKSDEKLLSSNGSVRDTVALEKYFEELESFVDLSSIDVAFVDQGFHTRGESVNYFFSKGIEFVFAHDFNSAPNLYGWNIIDNEKYNYKKQPTVFPTVCSWSL